MFDTDLLKTFVAVADSGGFTRAANILHSTQSTISAQIQRLESEAGRPLFSRSTRRIRLTSAGETLLGYARTILRLNEDARLCISGNGNMGRLRVGASEDLADVWLPEVLRRFRSRYPNIDVELEIGLGPNLFRKLETEDLDMAIGGLCDHAMQGRRLWKEPLVWAFLEDAKIPEVLPMAFFPQPCPYREAALRALASSPCPWHIACTSPSMAGVRAAALAGLAITPLPKHAMRAGLRVLGRKDGLPPLPPVEYFLQTQRTDKRSSVEALEMLILAKNRQGT